MQRVILFSLLLLTAVRVCAADQLPTVVSTNLCADWLALSLVEPQQLLAVSRQSHDPTLSPVTAQAKRFPAIRGSAEEVLHLKPDIVLVSFGWDGRRLRELLEAQDIRMVTMPYPRRWRETLETTLKMAKLLGQPERGQAIVARASARMRALQATTRPYRILYLRPNGGTAGANTYIDDVLTRLGLRNYAKLKGHSGWGHFPLEHLVMAKPDAFLLVSGTFDEQLPRRDSAYARHPLLQRLLQQAPAVWAPARYWGCGGWQLVETAEKIVRQVNALDLPPPGEAKRRPRR